MQQQQQQQELTKPRMSLARELFGPVLTAEFWKSLAKSLLTEITRASLIAFGGALVEYAKNKIKTDVPITIGGSSIGDRIWGQSPQPQRPTTFGGQEYRPASYPPAVIPSEPPNPTFPGFR